MEYLPFRADFRPVHGGQDQHEYIPIENYARVSATMPGQINERNQLGYFLYCLAAANDGPESWVEIGTWNGNGSSLCILNGFRDSQNQKKFLWSLECDPVFVKIAQENLKSHPNAKQLQVIQAKSGSGKFPEPSEITERGEHFYLNYAYEREFWNQSIPFWYPKKPDIVVLDGGEYTGMLDWNNIPKENLRYVVLDDVCCMKNKAVFQELCANRQWEPYQVNLNDRNGYAIFRKLSR